MRFPGLLINSSVLTGLSRVLTGPSGDPEFSRDYHVVVPLELILLTAREAVESRDRQFEPIRIDRANT